MCACACDRVCVSLLRRYFRDLWVFNASTIRFGVPQEEAEEATPASGMGVGVWGVGVLALAAVAVALSSVCKPQKARVE